ncbi:MAG: amino acid racemase, partial [Hyphomicrobiales bacterium]
PIGILGGMGPEATILLQRKIISAVPARDVKDHIPLLIDMNPQVPSRIEHLIEGTGENPSSTLAKMARRLEIAGAAALAMPCNTGHFYAKSIVSAVNIPFLNMIELAVRHALTTLEPGSTVGILASPAVQHTRQFEDLLERGGLSVVWPKDENGVLSAIRAIKISGPCLSACNTLLAASTELAGKGATFQFIACSEFSLISESVAPGVHAVDTVDLLAQAIVEFDGSRSAGI